MEALIWNIGTCRFDAKGKIQAENLQELNTDAKHRDGLIGSSEEAPVMGVERRGRHILDAFSKGQPIIGKSL